MTVSSSPVRRVRACLPFPHRQCRRRRPWRGGWIPLISAHIGPERRARPATGRARRGIARASGALVAALLVLGLGGPPAQAHALLLRSNPVSGSVLTGSPSAVTLWFDEEISPRVSTARL